MTKIDKVEMKRFAAMAKYFHNKLTKYGWKFPDRKYPSRSTVQRWRREFERSQ